MFERFTDRARKVMGLANEEAQRLNHEYIGTEHVLLGLVSEGTGVGAQVLKNFGVDLSKVRLEVEKMVKSGPEHVAQGKLPLTPRAKKLITFAVKERHRFNHNYVGTEHFLLGLLRERDGVAAQVLRNLGVDLDQVREEVLKLLGVGEESCTYEAKQLGSPSFKNKPASDASMFEQFMYAAFESGMFKQFTGRAMKVMALANQEAQRCNHEYVGTEHILLGMVKEGSGVGANVLRNLDVDLLKVRNEVEKMVKRGPQSTARANLPQTPRAKRVLLYAVEECRGLNHKYVSTEHILLGLLREQDGVASQVLTDLGLDLDETREEVLKLLGAGVESEEPPPLG